MDLGIKGRRAIVTGGSSGIGFETARQFLEEGARVLITGRNQRSSIRRATTWPSARAEKLHATVADMTKGIRHRENSRPRNRNSAASTFW
jgi:NAD(P)-dependent dehydrogenase (short-subunit alcohol dehydrogenase family)